MSRFELPFRGPYDLSAAIEFLEGWPPTAADRAAESQLRWATCIEGTWDPIEVTVTQHGPVLTVDYLGTDDRVAVEHHVARVLSVDVDGTGLVGVAARDPVAGVLIEASPGLRPTCFWTPYEAAVWGVISARSSMVQASRVKRRIADALGPTVGRIRAFPSPDRLLDVDSFPGISSVKIERLHAVARAALDGALDASHLRSLAVPDAMTELRRIPGVGPFTADLILVRGAGHPDVFPRHEQRLHRAMRTRYDLPDALVDELETIAAEWAPYRSWVSFLFRADAARRQS